MSDGLSLAGKRALVTGAATRVGRAIALGLGRAGASVAVHYHSSADAAERTAAEIRSAGGSAFTVSADLAERSQARTLVDQVTSRHGGLDLLVASAASFERVPYEQVDDAAWDRSLGLVLSSQFALAHRATPALRESRGSIVFITCSSTTTPFKNHLPYVVAKAGVKQLMRAMSLELAPLVRVNAVAPGTVLPPDDMSEAAVQRLVARIPLQRVGGADDIARGVLFLASTPFITGHELVVDGGRSVARVEPFG